MKRAARRRSTPSTVPLPPKVETTLTNRHTFVYRATSAGACDVTRGNLLNSLQLPYTTSPNTTYRLIDAIRVRRIRAWYMPSSGYTTDSFSLRWESENSSHRYHIRPDVGSATPGYYTETPPKGTLAGFYSTTYNDESQILFSMVFPNNTILYVDVDFTWADPIVNPAVTVPGWQPFSGDIGRVCCMYLNGVGSTVWQPQGITGIN